MNPQTRSWKHIALLFVPGTIWGLGFPLTELALETIPPITLSALRTIFVAAFFLILLRVRGGRLPRTLKAWRFFIVLGLVNDALPFILLSWGQVYLTSGLTTILISFNPFFTLLLAHFWTRDDRLTSYKLVGLSFGLVGVFILVGPEALSGAGISLLAQAAVIVASFAYAVGTILMAKNLASEPERRFSEKMPELLAGQLLASAVFIVPFAFLTENPFAVRPSSISLAAVVAQVIFGSGVALAVFYYLLSQTSASYVAFVVYWIPIVGVFAGAALLGEAITPQIFTALALTLVGVAILNRIIRLPGRRAEVVS